MIAIYVFGGFVLGFFVSWIVFRSVWQKRIESLKLEIAELSAYKKLNEEKLEWIKKTQQEMEQTFQALAGKIVEKNSESFLNRLNENLKLTFEKVKSDWDTHKAELKNLVDPLKENLTSLDTFIRELERKREGAYKGLQEQLSYLQQINSSLYKTTLTLAQALKSSSVRGRWGEIELKRIVELSGMTKHISFDEQTSTSEGTRPDMIIYLPNGGVLPVDSKVPLNSYLEAMETKDDREREIKFKEYAKAVRNRIKELGNKKYWKQFERSPEFVVMFVPNEQCLAYAFEADPGLIEYGIEQKVLIATPVTLLALLKAVAYGWQQVTLTENARKISKLAKELYDRFAIFLNHLSDLRKHINSSVESFNKLVSSLDSRLFPALKRFKDLEVANRELNQLNSIEKRPTLIKVKE